MSDVSKHRVLRNIAFILLHEAGRLNALNIPSGVDGVIISTRRATWQFNIFARPDGAVSSSWNVLGAFGEVLKADLVFLECHSLSDVWFIDAINAGLLRNKLIFINHPNSHAKKYSYDNTVGSYQVTGIMRRKANRLSSDRIKQSDYGNVTIIACVVELPVAVDLNVHQVDKFIVNGNVNARNEFECLVIGLWVEAVCGWTQRKTKNYERKQIKGYRIASCRQRSPWLRYFRFS